MFEIKFGIVSDYAFGGDKGKFSVINIFDKIKLGTYNNFTIRNFYVSFRFNIEQGTHNFKLRLKHKSSGETKDLITGDVTIIENENEGFTTFPIFDQKFEKKGVWEVIIDFNDKNDWHVITDFEILFEEII